jgi:hypothetical protein
MMLVRVVLGFAILVAVSVLDGIAYGLVLDSPRCCSLPLPVYSSSLAALACLIIAIAFERLFRSHPARVTLIIVGVYALSELLEALADSREYAATYLAATWYQLLIYVLGTPIVVLLIGRLRSNNRWRGP